MLSFPVCLLAAVAAQPPAPALAPTPPTALAEYVRKADPSFAWSEKGTTKTPAGTAYELAVTSQTWQGIRWEHAVQIFVPAGAKPTGTFVLWNQGGGVSPSSSLLGALLCQKIQAPVVFVYGVPNQPLFDGKKEDALIAETFVRYLETEDATWPLLFPMVKSVTAAMTAVQEFSAKQWAGHKVTGFVVTGASKRGWTSWLAAAAGDPRVTAIAPMVFDTLNFPAQMPHQRAAFGAFSAMIQDYTDRKLVPIPDTPAAKALWQMVDPWAYRAKLTLPKLVINGANDPYWTADALSLYWDGLPGDKHILHVPNAGHNLLEKTDSKGHTSRDRVVNTLCAFCRSRVFATPFPALTGTHTDPAGRPLLTMTADRPVKQFRVWYADAPTRDFRKAEWSPIDLDAVAAPKRSFAPDRPAGGFRAVFGEAEFDGFTLSTPVRILEPKPKP
ncbi:MAG: PhoPQ-activated pathogenicity-related family protein [Fimbriiglobus sp.]